MLPWMIGRMMGLVPRLTQSRALLIRHTLVLDTVLAPSTQLRRALSLHLHHNSPSSQNGCSSHNGCSQPRTLLMLQPPFPSLPLPPPPPLLLLLRLRLRLRLGGLPCTVCHRCSTWCLWPLLRRLCLPPANIDLVQHNTSSSHNTSTTSKKKVLLALLLKMMLLVVMMLMLA